MYLVDYRPFLQKKTPCDFLFTLLHNPFRKWSTLKSKNLLQCSTDNPFYIDTRYNDKIRYNDDLTVTKPSLKR